MIADRQWVHRNLGFDPIARPAPRSTFAVTAAAKRAASTEDLEREIIDFDSETHEGLAFLAFTTATGLSRFNDIPWPKGLEPKPDSSARKGATKPNWAHKFTKVLAAGARCVAASSAGRSSRHSK